VLCRLLGAERIGSSRNFFEIGANSLILARFAVDLAREIGRPVSVLDAFRYPTIRTLAARLTAAPVRIDVAAAGDARAEKRRKLRSGPTV
jgi:Phosphopantetheine attachment site